MNEEQIHIFDIDHTLIKESTASCFLRYGLKNRLFTLWQLLEFPLQWMRYRIGTLEKALETREFPMINGLPEETFFSAARNAFEQLAKPKIYQEALNLIADLRRQGRRIIFATSSCHFLVKPLADYFGVSEVIATRLERDNCHFTGRFQGPVMLGDKKRTAVEAYLRDNQLENVPFAFYSDSHNDLPLLSACHRPVAVNPDSRVRKIALKKGWQILDFSELHG